MKKIVMLLVLAATGYFVHEMSVFSTSKVNAFLDKFEDEVNKGTQLMPATA
jgi:cell division protein FtsW (lipid II flippase)